MDASDWSRVVELFDQIISGADSVSPESIDAFLAGESQDVVRQVRSLIEHHIVDDDLLAPPYSSEVRADGPDSDSMEALTGQTIGNFKIERLIGEGGMGTVYLAQQQIPRRLVALKMLHPAMMSKALRRRFSFESEALAKLQHPGIARIYEVGALRVGCDARSRREVPFFAMEYVSNALSITEYVDKQKFSVDRRLQLFQRLTDAIHYGHQRGLIHRDLKPDNVLINESGEVKVIDFGVAKTVDSERATLTRSTAASQIIGTLQYMSPEQCNITSNDIDIRSDIYSLGIILYEMVFGSRPYDLLGLPLTAAIRRITQHPINFPKGELARRSELILLISKAIAKDRNERYQSAAELSTDIGNFLANRPLVARSPSRVYLIRKMIVRNKLISLSILIAMLGLIWGTGASVIFGQKQQQAAAAARAAEEESHSSKQMARIALAASIRDENTATSQRLLNLVDEKDRYWEWHYLQGQSDLSKLTIVSKHESNSASTGIAASRDGRVVALASPLCDDIIVAFKSGTEYETHRFNVGYPLYDVVITESGELLATCGQGGIKVWQTSKDGSVVLTSRWNGLAKRLAIARSGKTLAASCGTDSDQIQIFSIEAVPLDGVYDMSPICLLEGTKGVIERLAFSPDGALLAACGSDRAIQLWNFVYGAELKNNSEPIHLLGHNGVVRDVAFSPDSRKLATVSIDGTICLWPLKDIINRNWQSGRNFVTPSEVHVQRKELRRRLPTAVAFHPDGKQLVTGDDLGLLSIHDAIENKEFANTRFEAQWTADDFTYKRSLSGHTGQIHSIVFLQNGDIITGSVDGEVKYWNAEREEFTSLKGHGSSVNGICLLPKLNTLITSSRALLCWNTKTLQKTERLSVPNSTHVHDVKARARGSAGLVIASGNTGYLSLLKVTDNLQLLNQVKVSNNVIRSVAIAERCDKVACGDQAGSVHILKIADQVPVEVGHSNLGGDGVYVSGLEFLDDEGRWLICAVGPQNDDKFSREQGGLWLWDLKTQVTTPIDCPLGSAFSLAVRPETGFSCEMATGHSDAIAFWTIEWTDQRPQLTLKTTLSGHADRVLSLQFHPYEPRLFSGSADRSIRLWDLRGNMQLLTLDGPLGRIWGLEFDESSETLFAASGGWLGADNHVWVFRPRRGS